MCWRSQRKRQKNSDASLRPNAIAVDSAPMRKILRFVVVALAGLALLLAIAWAAGALYFDLPFASLRALFALVYFVGSLAAFIFVKPRRRGFAFVAAGFGIVVAWWLTLKPGAAHAWQPDVALSAWAEIQGD